MSRAARLLTAAAALACAAAATPGARGLDHPAHRRAESDAGLDPGACSGCHLARSGRLARPDHRTCFARCHAPAPAPRRRGRPYRVAPERRPLCEVCHAASQLDAAVRGERTPLAVAAAPAAARDFSLTMSHAAHAGADCEACHRFRRARPPHDRCRGCHAGGGAAAARLPMSRCDRCHRRRGEIAEGLQIRSTPYSVAAAFDHGRHAPRVAATGSAPCVSCHRGLGELAKNVVPPPQQSSCAGARCHDGEAAFSTVGPSCRRCHRRVELPVARERQPRARLSHGSHGAVACEGCHPEGGAFDPRIGHALCAGADCHAAQWGKRQPSVCTVCHVGAEPWLPQHVDPPRRGPGDQGVRFDHARHGAEPGGERPCAGCHDGDPDDARAGLDAGHPSCAGAGCHDGEQPTMDRCQGCHVLGLRQGRRRRDAARPFSVRRAFSHARHKSDPGGGPLACDSCHPASKSGPLPPPPKKRCVGCHDGRTAFKVTGHGCVKCHGPG